MYTKAEIQNCTLSNSWVDNFLGILQKLQTNYFLKTFVDGYFKLASGISLKSVLKQGWKIRRANHGAEH